MSSFDLNNDTFNSRDQEEQRDAETTQDFESLIAPFLNKVQQDFLSVEGVELVERTDIGLLNQSDQIHDFALESVPLPVVAAEINFQVSQSAYDSLFSNNFVDLFRAETYLPQQLEFIDHTQLDRDIKSGKIVNGLFILSTIDLGGSMFELIIPQVASLTVQALEDFSTSSFNPLPLGGYLLINLDPEPKPFDPEASFRRTDQ